MLLVQWFAWWESIEPLQAEQRLSAYTTALLADSGWKMEREPVLEGWRELAEGGRPQHVLTASESEMAERDKLIASVYRVRDWVARSFGGAVVRDDG